ncbi:YegS/Rv2252/BmrU family lipid kinase [Clostridium sp. 'White wine YQ']|uniref:YegS/Rv2252/BmrU family lipid kinase n=1 Tax=Clostridium sp. 'White wine YQ' TaxID=3027474 RepID=UPI0023667A53|nr:YegS/Rv2252/BmrU family lipid kinase [Clostridium sp. 'White wine YQ']MDD7792800.1 YegS/Rv2252/BmrU family lipid kinase [Clostridium sp. 'White wine YQ']
MKKVKFIYNPFSGENLILSELDKVISIHQEFGYQVVPFRIEKGITIDEALNDIDESFYYILVAGGDGTVDSLVNAMKERNIDIPLGILPVGTANDFARFLGLPQDVSTCVRQILSSKPKGVDIGKINNKYFVNVASTGLFTDVSQKTDLNLKNTIGKLAYYLKGLEQLPNFRKLKVNIKSKEVEYDGYMYLLLVFNGQTAGSFNLATSADIMDGYLDVIMFKAITIIDLIPLFIKVLRGEHLDSPNVLYFKTDNLIIESPEDIVTDIDGERGPDFPLNIQCIKNGIQVLGIK